MGIQRIEHFGRPEPSETLVLSQCRLRRGPRSLRLGSEGLHSRHSAAYRFADSLGSVTANQSFLLVWRIGKQRPKDLFATKRPSRNEKAICLISIRIKC